MALKIDKIIYKEIGNDDTFFRYVHYALKYEGLTETALEVTLTPLCFTIKHIPDSSITFEFGIMPYVISIAFFKG